jgi:DNA replication licensing factor MCM7
MDPTPTLSTAPGGGGGPGAAIAATTNYKDVQERCKEFLANFAHRDSFCPDSHGPPKLKYMIQLDEVYKRTRKVLAVELEDVYEYGLEPSGAQSIGASSASSAQAARVLLHDEIAVNASRFVELFSSAADEILADIRANQDGGALDLDPNDPVTLLIETRRQREEDHRAAQAQAENIPGNAVQTNPNVPSGPGADPRNFIPAIMTRTYETLLIPRPTEKAVPLREVRAVDIGSLVTISGIVTRVTEVKPRVAAAAYHCRSCGYEVYQEVTGRSFMPVITCPSPEHQGRGRTPGHIVPYARGHKYVKYQELKLQEHADQVPIGCIPRSMSVKLNGELTRTCTAGDNVTISGIFLPMPFTGVKAMKAGLLADTFLDAMHVTQMRKSYDEDYVSDEMRLQLESVRQTPDLYDRLSRSIAPEIFGNEDVKKALLLLLLGAPPKSLPDGMRLRGDIHICLMGDPGVAKSQLLKHITKVAPRAVYTTGKGSSGVGLTAAVLRDAVTNELMLEGGALVLADMGIACIDEFDKMNETDRTAIHEVMEQQTVSISKAGITTSLNARASVLAAANPAYGRYNRFRTPAENINLPAALLSRFDLLFLLLDRPMLDQDLALARHITHVHRTGAHPPLGFDVVDSKLIRAHIADARKVLPVIPPDGSLTEYIVDNYVAMRAQETEDGDNAKGYTSPRVLLSILRLGQALARLRLAEVVEKEDVDEAIRLMESSKESLEEKDSDMRRRRGSEDDDGSDVDFILGRGGRSGVEKGAGKANLTWSIYSMISEFMHKEKRTVVDIETAEGLCDDAGYTRDELMKTIDEYEELDIWSYDTEENRIMMVY